MSYEQAKQNIAGSLSATNLGYIDLYLIHVPFGGKEARLGVWQALVEGVQEGKIRSIGVSNFAVRHLDELEGYIKEKEAKEGEGKGGVVSVNQVELHPWMARREVAAWCRKRGIVFQAWGPLARAMRWGD